MHRNGHQAWIWIIIGSSSAGQAGGRDGLTDSWLPKTSKEKSERKKDSKREGEREKKGRQGGNNYAKYGFHACQRTTTPGKWIWNMPLICTQCTVYTERKKKRERQHWNLLNNLWPQLRERETETERGRAARRSRSCFIILLHVSIWRLSKRHSPVRPLQWQGQGAGREGNINQNPTAHTHNTHVCTRVCFVLCLTVFLLPFFAPNCQRKFWKMAKCHWWK